MAAMDDRPKIMILVSVSTTVGQILMSLTAYLTQNWRIFLRFTYAPAFLFILSIFWVDESLRWLLIKGKKAEAQKILRRAIRMNKIQIDDSRIKNIYCENTESASLWTSIRATLSSKKLFIRLLICICVWFTSLFNTYSLLINSVSLEGNKYLNFSLVGLCGTVSGFILCYVLTKFNRKGPLILSFALTGLFCVAQALLPHEGYRWLSTSLYLCGKLTATMSMRTSYLYTSELFPTYTRNTMLALCSSIGRISIILAPQTPLLVKYWAGLPALLIGILSLVTATVVTFVPDTSKDALPDNVKQAEAVGIKPKNNETSHF